MRQMLAMATVSLALCGCSFERFAVDSMVDVFRRSADRMHRSAVPRQGREAAPGLLLTLDGFVETCPDNVELQLLKADVTAGFAFAWIEREDADWARHLYRDARGAALAALREEEGELADVVREGEVSDLEEALYEDGRPREFGEETVAALFWTGLAWAGEINVSRDDTEALGDLPRVERIVGWVAEMDETFYDGGPHLVLALMHCRPRRIGGDPEKAKRHFEAVQRITGGRHLLARVLFAENYAPLLQQVEAGTSMAEADAAAARARRLFLETLEEVVAAPEDLWPRRRLLNALARERARELIAAVDDYILPPPAPAPEPPPGEEPSEEDLLDVFAEEE